MANTRMSLSHSRYLQCYLKIRYIHDALRLGMQQCAMHNATIQKTTCFELDVYITLAVVGKEKLATAARFLRRFSKF